jgi:hypothetical protein
VQEYISAKAGMDLSKVFAQYLTTTKIPVFEYRLDGSSLTYRWADVVPGFAMPVDVVTGEGRTQRLTPRESWQTTTLALERPDAFHVDDDFYVDSRLVERSDATPPATGSAR